MPSANQALELGQSLEEFTIVKVLGAGGFGITYQGIDRTLQRNVAIKEYFPQQYAERRRDHTIVSRPGDDNSETFRWGLDRFLVEARTLASIDHPNVVKVSRFFQANGTAYLIMAFEDGSDLEDWIEERREPLTEADLKALILPLLDGMEALHAQGLIHRDIKPRNIVIRSNGTPVLIDFGSARAVGRAQTSLTAVISPGFSPPEQYGNDPSSQGPWTDIYAMAGVIYQLIVGRGPPEALTRVSGTKLDRLDAAAAKRFSGGVLSAVEKGLSLAVDDRPQTVAEFRALLLDETPRRPTRVRTDNAERTHVRAAERPADAPRSATPLRAIVAALAVVAVLLIGALVYRESARDVEEDSNPAFTALGNRLIGGTWTGQFACTEKFGAVVAGLDLTIHPRAPDGGPLLAEFSFYPLDAKTLPDSGRFTMRGSYGFGSRQLKLDPVEWLERPVGYDMVGFEGVMDASTDSLRGKILDSRCGEVTLVRKRPSDSAKILQEIAKETAEKSAPETAQRQAETPASPSEPGASSEAATPLATSEPEPVPREKIAALTPKIEAADTPIETAVKAAEGDAETLDDGVDALIAGTWTGQYVCGQGVTGLDLTIERRSATAAPLSAEFYFYPLNRQSLAKSGRFTMGGFFDAASGQLRLYPVEWLERPADYSMVGLEGMLDKAAGVLKGKILDRNCSEFSIARR